MLENVAVKCLSESNPVYFTSDGEYLPLSERTLKSIHLVDLTLFQTRWRRLVSCLHRYKGLDRPAGA